jgi:hypothetical protein
MYFIRKKYHNECIDSPIIALSESMHSFGNTSIIDDIICIIENIVVSLKDQIDSKYNKIYINCDINKQKSLAKYKDIYYVKSKELQEYIPNDINVNWIHLLHISALVFYKDCKEEYEKMSDDISFIRGQYEIGNYSYYKDNSIIADFNLYGCCLIKNKIVSIDSSLTLKEAMYHELMHAYTYYNIHKNTGKSEEYDEDYETILRYLNIDFITSDDKLKNGLYTLINTLYSLSDDEIKAYSGMTYEHFKLLDKSLSWSSKKIVNEIDKTVCGNILQNGKDALSFLMYCNDENILNKYITITGWKKPFATINEILQDILSHGFVKTSSNNIFTKISVAAKVISNRLNKFKKNVYNIAYDIIFNKQ